VGETPAEANVSAEEAPYLEDVRWSLHVLRVDPPQTAKDFRQVHHGTDVVNIEDLSPESQQRLAKRGDVRWRATLTNRVYSPHRWRFVAFVEDSAVPHLADIHASSRCSFVRAWKAFNRQHQGHSHVALSWCSALLGFFIPVSAAAAFIVYRCSAAAGEQDAENGCCDCGGYGFHVVVMLKFLTTDIPQQVCIVLYVLGWYEAEGLRCQLCLFHPRHCEEEHPFRLASLIAFSCTSLSSSQSPMRICSPSLARCSPPWRTRCSSARS